ncbi:MAG TPA: carboxypeptidase-like regulatory domain-containing protein, partial [Bryobacteraceae bacterium]|nr:carboxypeptidase-like regulatory domain-containing protein [Bryobacteraceae bacterium]
MTKLASGLVLCLLSVSGMCLPLAAQSINSGTVTGTIIDQSGAVVRGAVVSLRNPISGYQQSAVTDDSGAFRFNNVPQNPYQLTATASGFSTASQDVEVRSSIPLAVNLSLKVASGETTVTVQASAAMIENDPSAHVDVDRGAIMKIPAVDPAGGLSQTITYSTGGVAADANGLYHPLGDHFQSSFIIDGQPISDQQSKIYSTQIPITAVQSMEVITGTPDAEFGDKSSLVAQVTTRSGLGSGRVFGNVDASYGTFGTTGGSFGLGYGNEKFGNFLAVDGVRSGRFLDTPELTPFHDIGNNQTIFDHFDYQPGSKDVFHLNLFTARNWLEIPNSYDQLPQDQRQRVLTWSMAPGYQHTFNAHTLLTINPYIRKDQFNYYP